MRSGYSTCSKLFFYMFTNLIQIEEKTQVPVTVYFHNYVFNENIHMYCFHEWEVFLIYIFLWHTKTKEQVSFEKERKLLSAQFLVKFVVTCAINHIGKLIPLHACLHERNRSGLIGKLTGFTSLFLRELCTVDCMIFLSPFLDVMRISMSAISFLAKLDLGILCK